MSDSKERKNGVILSYVSIIFSTILQLIYMPFLIHQLGNSEYGIYSLVASIIGYLVILDFGFGDAIIMYTAKYHAQQKYDAEKKLHGMFLLIFSIIGVATAIFGFIIYLNVPSIFGNSMTTYEIQKMKILMLILTFNLSITFPFSIYSSIISAYEKFTFKKVISILNSMLQPVLMIPLLFLGYKSISLTLVITFLNLGVLFSNWFYCRKKLNIKIKYYGFDKKLFKEIFGYSFYIFLNIIVDKLNWSADQFILGIYSGTLSVSLYSVASKLNDMFLRLSSAISGTLFPKMSKMIAQNSSNEELTKEFIKVGRLQYYIVFLATSGLILFGKEFFTFWLGNEYIYSYYIALILIIPVNIALIQNLGISILQAKNMHRFRCLLYFALAVFNIIISIPLAKYFGGIGAAFGTALVAILGSGITMNIYYYKKTKLDIPKFWKEILKMTAFFLIPIVCLITIKYFFSIQNIFHLVLYILIYILIYLFISYKFVLNKYEIGLFNNLLKKFHLKK